MTYLVGYSSHKDDTCAISLACELARTTGIPVHALTVVPRGWLPVAGSATDGEFRAWAAASGEESANEALALLTEQGIENPTATWVTGRSVPAVMVEQAEELGAQMIVVGSGLDGAIHHVRLTSKTTRLMHSSHVPIAVAPRGYQSEPGSKFNRVTLAFRDDNTAWQLLDRVADICKESSLALRLMTVVIRHRVMVTSPVRADEDLVFDRAITQAEEAQAEAVAHLRELNVDADTVIAKGGSWSDAVDRVAWSAGDVLVVGSSSTKVLAHVFLGSSATKIVQNSPVPVIVVP